MAQLLRYVGGWNVVQAVLRVLLSSVVVGSLIWWFERQHNPHFQHGAVRGIGQGIWFAIVTLGTFGYGDVTPVRLPGRLVAVLWMAVSFFVLADFIATLTAARQASIASLTPESLRGEAVGAIAGTTGNQFLRTQPYQPSSFDAMDGALAALAEGEISGLILDEPTAKYHASLDPTFLLVGERLNREDYGIAVQEGDRVLLESINRTLLELQQRNIFAELDRRWFQQGAL
ncbi:MAG: transporter substrate-binding domain-containing protein [Leptolyngbyaceae cyanobacterium SL_7_1]|nr:transporter substrate-binding domain-containing protein [Leptolyngbyaceae cyanobacterium SL_7_1]